MHFQVVSDFVYFQQVCFVMDYDLYLPLSCYWMSPSCAIIIQSCFCFTVDYIVLRVCTIPSRLSAFIDSWFLIRFSSHIFILVSPVCCSSDILLVFDYVCAIHFGFVCLPLNKVFNCNCICLKPHYMTIAIQPLSCFWELG